MSSREAHEIARCALGNATIHQACFDSAKVPDAFDMTHKIHEEEVVNQQNTGTCWLQAGMTFLSSLARRRGLTVRFSLTHLVYWDKLGKAEAFLECIYSTLQSSAAYQVAHFSVEELQKICGKLQLSDVGDATDLVVRINNHAAGSHILQTVRDRIRWHLLHEPICDGGTWGMFMHIIQTYGVVPHDARLPMRQATQSSQLNRYVNDYLRQKAQQIIDAPNNYLKIKLEAIQKVQQALERAYGPPSGEATLFENVHGRDFNGTPTDLLGMLRQTWPYVVLTHAPDRPNAIYVGTATNDHKNLKQDTFRVVDMDTLVGACIHQLECGIPVWFTCDVKFDFCAKHGIAATGLFNTPLLLGLDRRADKINRMKAYCTAPGHAMLLTGVKLVNGKPVLWRIQNSWGKQQDYGEGFLTADHAWFKEYVFQAAVDAHFLNALTTTSETEAITLYPWDVFATVA